MKKRIRIKCLRLLPFRWDERGNPIDHKVVVKLELQQQTLIGHPLSIICRKVCPMDYWKEGILHSRSPTLSNFALFLYAMVHKRKSISRLLQRSKRCCRKPNYLCYNKLFPLPIMSFINDKFIIGLALVQYLKFLCSLTLYSSIIIRHAHVWNEFDLIQGLILTI